MNPWGRPRTRMWVEEALQLKIGSLHAAGALAREGYLEMTWPEHGRRVRIYSEVTGEIALSYVRRGKSVLQRIRVDYQPCRLGGSRPWFRCPHCDRRCGSLFLSGQFTCRRCSRLLYFTQSTDPINRLAYRQIKLVRRITANTTAGMNDLYRRPGMHQATYARLMSRLEALRIKREYVFMTATARWVQRNRRRV